MKYAIIFVLLALVCVCSADILFGVTGNTDAQPATVFIINQDDASNEAQVTSINLTSSGTTEVISFGTTDNKLYHWSGANIYEDIDIETGDIDDIDLVSVTSYDGFITGAGEDRNTGDFLVSTNLGSLYQTSRGGFNTLLLNSAGAGEGISISLRGATDGFSGIAYTADSQIVYLCEPNNNNLHVAQAATLTQNTLLSLVVQNDAAQVVTGCQGLARDPDSGIYYILYSTSTTTTPNLGALNFNTGQITPIGHTGREFVSLASINADDVTYTYFFDYYQDYVDYLNINDEDDDEYGGYSNDDDDDDELGKNYFYYYELDNSADDEDEGFNRSGDDDYNDDDDDNDDDDSDEDDDDSDEDDDDQDEGDDEDDEGPGEDDEDDDREVDDTVGDDDDFDIDDDGLDDDAIIYDDDDFDDSVDDDDDAATILRIATACLATLLLLVLF